VKIVIILLSTGKKEASIPRIRISDRTTIKLLLSHEYHRRPNMVSVPSSVLLYYIVVLKHNRIPVLVLLIQCEYIYLPTPTKLNLNILIESCEIWNVLYVKINWILCIHQWIEKFGIFLFYNMHWMKHVAIYTKIYKIRHSNQIFVVSGCTHYTQFYRLHLHKHTKCTALCNIIWNIKYTLLTVCLQIGATNT